MSVMADADQEQHPGGDEWTRDLPPALQPDEARVDPREQAPSTPRSSRRARRRSTRRQAVFRRRRPFFLWSDEATRVTTGLAVLLFLIVAVSVQGLLERRHTRE